MRSCRSGGEGVDVVAVEVIEPETASGGHLAPAVGGEHHLIHFVVEAAKLQDAFAVFCWIVEAVVSGGEAFVVGDHQFGSELVVAQADDFEALAHGFVGGGSCGGFEKGGRE